jgi:hypothetical protein
MLNLHEGKTGKSEKNTDFSLIAHPSQNEEKTLEIGLDQFVVKDLSGENFDDNNLCK